MASTLLPTAVVGSYSMPGWLQRAKNDYLLRRITAHDLEEMHDAAVKAALKDHEVEGVDNVADGSPRAGGRLPLPAPVHRATHQGLGHRSAVPRQAHPQPVLSERGGVRPR